MTDAEKTARIAEIEIEIAEINTALSHIRKGGQNYSITTGSGFGSARSVGQADYTTLVNHKKELTAEKNTLEGERASRLRAGW